MIPELYPQDGQRTINGPSAGWQNGIFSPLSAVCSPNANIGPASPWQAWVQEKGWQKNKKWIELTNSLGVLKQYRDTFLVVFFFTIVVKFLLIERALGKSILHYMELLKEMSCKRNHLGLRDHDSFEACQLQGNRCLCLPIAVKP